MSIICIRCRCGGIGRRSGFKIRRWKQCVGSSPTTGTITIEMQRTCIADFSLRFLSRYLCCFWPESFFDLSLTRWLRYFSCVATHSYCDVVQYISCQSFALQWVKGFFVGELLRGYEAGCR